MSTFLLVSGAWHAAWCWQRITPLLEAGGHRVIAPDLLGMGEDKTPLSQVTLGGWADQIADLVQREASPVILVGHSRGGIVISEVAERAPERIATLVYLTAFLLPSGGTVAATVGMTEDASAGGLLQSGPDHTATVVPAQIEPVFYNATDRYWLEEAQHRLGPEPIDVFFTPLSVSPARFGAVRRAFIECANDHAIPLALQRKMQAELPCSPVVTLDSDHSPFFSAPEALASALQGVARELP